MIDSGIGIFFKYFFGVHATFLRLQFAVLPVGAEGARGYVSLKPCQRGARPRHLLPASILVAFALSLAAPSWQTKNRGKVSVHGALAMGCKSDDLR